MARTRKADEVASAASTVFPIRFGAADLDAIKRAANAERVTAAQFIRTAALRAAEVLGELPLGEPTIERRVEHLERVAARHEAALALLARLPRDPAK